MALLFFADWIANTEHMARFRKTTIRAIQVGTIVVGVVIGGTIFCPLWKAERAANLGGDLLGAGQVFTDDVKRGFPMVQIGRGTTLVMSSDGVSDIFPFFKDSGVKIETGKVGPLLTTTIRDRNGNLVAEVTRNHWRVHPQYSVDKNYSKDALEVQDSAGHVVLQVNILPMTIQIQGEWWNTQDGGVRMLENPDPSTGSAVVPMNYRNQHDEALIKPMFKYPSKYHWSELAKDSEVLPGERRVRRQQRLDGRRFGHKLRGRQVSLTPPANKAFCLQTVATGRLIQSSRTREIVGSPL